MAVVITNSKADGTLTYDAVGYAWKLSGSQLQKANKSQYILAIVYGTMVDIFDRHGDFRPAVDNPDRYRFFPVPVIDASLRRRYIGKYYRSSGAAVMFSAMKKIECNNINLARQ